MKSTEVQPNDILLNITGGSLGRCAVVPSDFERGNVSQHVCILRPILVGTQYLHCFILSGYFSQTMKVTGSGREGLPKYNLGKMVIPIPPLNEQTHIVEEINKWFSLISDLKRNESELNETVEVTKAKVLDLAIHGKLVPQDPNDEPAIGLLKRINPNTAICDTSHYGNLPKGWCSATIKQLCDVMGGLWTGKKPPYVNVGVIRNTNFSKDFKLDLTNVAYLDVERHQYEKRKLQYGDLILEKSGGSDKQPVGRVILYDNEEGDFSYSNFTSRLRIKDPSVIIPQFLFYALLYAYLNGETQSMQKQTTGIHNLIMDKYLSVSVPVPPINEQNRIVQKIQKIEGKIREISAEL